MKEIPLPILPETAPEDPSSQLAGFSPLQGEFLLLSVKLGLFSQLDERSKKLIIQRATTTGPLDSLRDVAGVTTRERVRQIIVEGLRTIHEKIPPELKEHYNLGEILSLDYGKKTIFSPEARAKISAAHKGRPSPMRGRTHSQETRDRMSAAHKGRTHSQETRDRISAALKNKWQDQGYHDRISAAHKGRPSPMRGRTHSQETRDRISAALKNKWQEKKNSQSAPTPTPPFHKLEL